MRARLLRVRGLARRLWVDRRLPPMVSRLYTRTFSLRARARLHGWLGAVRPVLGGGGSGLVAGAAGRRMATAGPIAMSFDDLAHHYAGAVVEVLGAAEVDVFVVAREGQSIVLGVDLGDRGRAWSALAGGLDGPWMLASQGGGGDRPTPLRAAGRRARSAPSWKMFEPFSWGDTAVGGDVAAVVSFWEIGSSRLLERVGERGQERFDPRSVPTTEMIDGREYPGRAAFRVGTTLNEIAAPVDVVYTWVDGQDAEWLASFRETATILGREFDHRELDPARFRSRDELRYSMRSVWAYCGWVRKIWVVTAGQTPRWLMDHERVTLVDHRSILPADALPTFNSHAIEAALHRIEGLAEHFVYLNDDVFIGRPIRPELFFEPNGLPRVFRSEARVPSVEDAGTPAFETALIRSAELLGERVGRVPTRALAHAPFPLRRSLQAEVEDVFSDAVGRTMRSRFRSADDVSVASALGPYYGIATGRASFGEISGAYVNVESSRLLTHLDRIRLGDDLDVCCINETSDSDAGPRVDDLLDEFFNKNYPVAAPWERRDDELP